MSQNTTCAPVSVMASAVAMAVCTVVMTSSPGPMPRLFKVLNNAEVAHAVPQTGAPFRVADISFSKPLTSAPPM